MTYTLGQPGEVEVGDRVVVCDQHGHWTHPGEYYPTTMVDAIQGDEALVQDMPQQDSRMLYTFTTAISNLRAVCIHREENPAQPLANPERPV